ncbi:MAG: 4-hydroxy-2-oxovalerate aldolase [Cytophagales bacterium]|nr:4-hydroxy-2-oxovalerate aldolase [Cytophaga sp.]
MINIVENTLRDGSYVIDFQFNSKQTEDISSGLSKLGFKLIEVGHGLGLGAWNNPKAGLSRENDETYIRSAIQGAPNAEIGVFFIPGIGTIEDMDKAIDLGIKFIRIGSNVDTYANTLKFAEHAKKRGMLVAINLMKSYGVKSYEFTTIAKDIDTWKLADAIYLVDSAGCMMPQDVFEYIDRTREKVSTPIGFHGHINLSLAVAISIQAIQAGATYIDSCVRGMGRSAGNAQTEIMIYILQKMGLSPIDTEIYALYDFANTHIVPLMPYVQGLSDEEIHIGISRFHTSYAPVLEKVSKETGVDVKRLMKMVSDINCINPVAELFSEAAKKIKQK